MLGARVAESVLRSLGETARIEAGAQVASLRLVYLDAGGQLALGASVFPRPEPRFIARAADVAAIGLAPNHIIERPADSAQPGARYTVIGIEPADETGLVAIAARRYSES